MTTTATSAAPVPPNPRLHVRAFAQLFLFTGNGHVIDPVDITKRR